MLPAGCCCGARHGSCVECVGATVTLTISGLEDRDGLPFSKYNGVHVLTPYPSHIASYRCAYRKAIEPIASGTGTSFIRLDEGVAAGLGWLPAYTLEIQVGPWYMEFLAGSTAELASREPGLCPPADPRTLVYVPMPGTEWAWGSMIWSLS